MKLIICLSAVMVWTLTALATAQTADWPGVWAEVESGRSASPAEAIQYASGARAISLQAKGSEVAVELNVAEAIPNATLMLRYAREAKDVGLLDVYVAPASAASIADAGARKAGQLTLPSTGRVSQWTWLRLSVGDVGSGRMRVFLVSQGDVPAGWLDLVGLVPTSTRGLWQPPNDVLVGSFRDRPRVAEAFELTGVSGPTFGDLLPEPIYLGSQAKPVEYALRIKSNLFPQDLKLSIRGELRGEDGKVIELPPQDAIVPADVTQPVRYAFTLPGAGRYALTLFAEGEGVRVETKRWLTTVPVAPTWVTPGKPVRLVGPGARASIDLDLPTDVPAGLVYVSYQRSVRDPSQGSEPMDVWLAPASARDEKAPGARKLGVVRLMPLERFGEQERWAVVNAGALGAGKHRLLLGLSGEAPVRTDGALRPAINTIRQVGVVSDVDRGRWLPPVESLDAKHVASTQQARLLEDAVHVESISCDEVGHLFLGSKVQGATLPFKATLVSQIVTAPTDAVVRTKIIDANGAATDGTPVAVHLAPGERCTIDLPVRAPGFGWYALEVTAEAMSLSSKGHSAFGVLRDPHEGVRPDSMFGLSIGDKPQDMHVARLIGVKWRRGIPFTNPADVFRKSGDPLVLKPEDTITVWGEPEIQKARDVIAQWKQAGVMCLGYVNYNLPWNCLGGAAQGWHKNRPADMQQHVEMVYNLIKPLHDEVKYWEIWNEPWVGGWTWRTGTAQDYRDMSRLIWDRIKPEMPDVMLVGGGSTSYNRDVLFAQGSDNAGYADGVSTHPYGKPDTNHPAFAALEAKLLERHARGGGKGGIWATELGTAAYMFEPLPRREADLMVARTVAPLYLLAKLGAGETPIRLFFFASLYGDSRFSGGEHNFWDAVGGTPAPRPALVAFSALTHFVEDARLLGDIYATSKSGWALHFVRRDGASVVVYIQEQSATGDIDPVRASESEHARGEMTLPAGDFEVFDYLGRPIGTREGKLLRIPTQVWEARYLISRRPPEQVRQDLLAARFSGVPRLLVNPCSFDAPLTQKPALRFKVENALPYAIDARIDVTPPAEITLDSRAVEIQSLQPGEIRWVDFTLSTATPSQANRYLIKYRVTVAGVSQDREQVVQVAFAQRGTPTIDGRLDDWDTVTPVTMLSRGGKDWRQIAMDPSQAAALLAHKQPSDTAIYQLSTQWDDRFFYVAARVPAVKRDLTVPYDGPIATTRNMPFMHDCLQLAFATGADNPDDLLRGHPIYEKSMAADVDYEFVAAMRSDGTPVVERLKAPGTNFQTYYPVTAVTSPPLGPIPDAQAVIRYDEKEQAYVYEVAIPWRELGALGTRLAHLPRGEALRTGFAFSVNVPGGPGRSYWTQEAGDLQAGSYGFSPTWGGGSRKMGGRVLTQWTFR